MQTDWFHIKLRQGFSVIVSGKPDGQVAADISIQTGRPLYITDRGLNDRYDIRGSVTTIVDGAGSVVKSYDYDEFGATSSKAMRSSTR